MRKKAATFAQDFTSDGEQNGSSKIDVDGVVDLYESYIIPLTKEVEVSKKSSTSCANLTMWYRWNIYYTDSTVCLKRISRS